jgi:hypothetical protein
MLGSFAPGRRERLYVRAQAPGVPGLDPREIYTGKWMSQNQGQGGAAARDGAISKFVKSRTIRETDTLS